MLPCLTGLDCCLSEEDKRNCHSYVTSIMAIKQREHYRLLFFYLYHQFCRFCMYITSPSCYIRMLCGNVCVNCVVVANNAYVVSHECKAFLVLCDVSYFKTIPFLRRFLFYQM